MHDRSEKLTPERLATPMLPVTILCAVAAMMVSYLMIGSMIADGMGAEQTAELRLDTQTLQ